MSMDAKCEACGCQPFLCADEKVALRAEVERLRGEVTGRPVLMVHADYSEDDVATFYEVPKALADRVQPEGERRTFCECLSAVAALTEGAKP